MRTGLYAEPAIATLKLKMRAGVTNLRGRMREFLGPKDY